MAGRHTFRSKVASRWPHFTDGRSARFTEGATPEEMRRVALETQLDCKIQCRAHLVVLGVPMPKLLFSGDIRECAVETLPSSYVVKPRCQTGVVMVIKDGFDLKTQKLIAADELRRFFSSQWCYRGLNNDVVVEELVTNEDTAPCVSQVKCLVFHGRTEFIRYVRTGYDQTDVMYDYDRSWKRVFLYTNSRPIEVSIAEPTNFKAILAMADRLGKYYEDWTGTPHVRVDIFDCDTGPVFGEYAGGTNGGEGFTEDAQMLLGSLW